MNRAKLDRDRKKKVEAAEAAAGIREGHYNLDGQFVEVWVSFYPKTQWFIADCERPRGQHIQGSSRQLDEDIKAKLENWL